MVAATGSCLLYSASEDPRPKIRSYFSPNYLSTFSSSAVDESSSAACEEEVFPGAYAASHFYLLF